MSLCNPKAYAVQIRCISNDELRERMELLFSKGFVFTEARYTTWAQAKARYADWNCWRWIRAGHSNICSKILNTNSSRKLSWPEVSWDDFVKDVLPLF